MRPIDADYITEGRVSNDPVVIAAKCAPTIDAIPVEWIEWRIAYAEREGFGATVSMLRTVWDWWNDQRDLWQKEKEQEAQDG